jgi:HK97 family phage major capsid protein
MTSTTTTTPRAWLPQDILELVVQPVGTGSIAAQVAGYRSGLTGNALRVPLVTTDPSAAWVNEGEEIPLSEAELGEVEAAYRKLAGLAVVSRELAEDSDPAAAEQIGEGLVRDLARKLDAAFFGSNVATPKAPAGLEDLAGVTVIEAPATLTDLDPFSAARFRAAVVGARLSAFVAHPDDAEDIATIKESGTSAKRLLQPDATAAGVLQIDGTPLLTSPAVAAGTIWGIPQGRAVIGVRQDVDVRSDSSAFFTSDRVAIRATLRAAFAFSHPAAVMRISVGATV